MTALKFLFCIVVLLISSGTSVEAFWRMLCKGTLATARIDPVVNYGKISPHAHNIVGASNFGYFTNAADLMASNCSSCEVTEDKSVYWTPALYFEHDNGTYELVQTTGGMTVYYFNDNTGFVTDSNGNSIPAEPITAFPPDFRMIAGNTSLRDFPYPVPDPPMSFWTANDMTQAALAAKATGFNCLNYNLHGEGAMEYHYLRNKTFLDATCAQGVRFEIEFPSCWDGVRLDSEDHKSHILYPDLIKTGACPEGFNVRTPVVFFETIWNTFDFVDHSGTFVIANGDTEGYGYHGDFYSGWNQSFLQQAVNTCTNLSGLTEDCHLFTLQSDSVSTSCFLDMPQELRQEDCQGLLPALPGNISIATGPELAAKMEGTPVAGPYTPPASSTLPSGSTFASDVSVTVPPTTATPAASNTPAQASASPSSSLTFTAPTPATVTSGSLVSSITTPAPSSDSNNALPILTTSVFTADGHEIDLVVFEDVVTVTVHDVVGPVQRHIHKHAHVHGQG